MSSNADNLQPQPQLDTPSRMPPVTFLPDGTIAVGSETFTTEEVSDGKRFVHNHTLPSSWLPCVMICRRRLLG